jgi:hypothetical protein
LSFHPKDLTKVFKKQHDNTFNKEIDTLRCRCCWHRQKTFLGTSGDQHCMTSTSLSHTHSSSLSVKETHSQRRCHCLRTSSPASSNTEAAIHEGKLQTSPRRSPTPLNITHSTPHLRLVPIEGSAPPRNQPPRWQHRLASGATPLSRVSSDLPSCDLKLACRPPK